MRWAYLILVSPPTWLHENLFGPRLEGYQTLTYPVPRFSKRKSAS
jgi:hypothetical protein